MFKWKNKEFSDAYNEYYSLIASIAYSKVGSVEDAEDIAQEVFITFFNKFDQIKNIRKWLNTTLRFKILSYYKKKEGVKVDIDTLNDDVTLSYINGFRDLRIVLNEIIENDATFENETGKIVFLLISVHKYTYEEVMSELGLTKKQVRNKYSLSIRCVLECLRKKGIFNPEDLL